MVVILFVLQHSSCLENVIFHFVIVASQASFTLLNRIFYTSFRYLKFQIYSFEDVAVFGFISTSIHFALDFLLNYAHNYLTNPDSNLILVNDIAKLAAIPLKENPTIVLYKAQLHEGAFY
ncbi:putative galacturonosyltransferase-like 2 [Glycine soja]